MGAPPAVTSVRRQLVGDPFAEIVEDHRERMGAAFDALERMGHGTGA
ncbi:hypothetical protein ABZ357_06500 [Streptomyces sp. NPDC005917]